MRRKRGRPLDGWLIIDKPAGLTSADMVNRVRRAFDARKAGHGGTLALRWLKSYPARDTPPP